MSTRFIIIVTSLMLHLPLLAHAQHGYWQWANSGADQGMSETKKVATDNAGNMYATGSFTGELQLDVTTLVSRGKSDVFIAKYDPAGIVLWARSLGGPEEDAGVGIAVDTAGNVYATGSYIDTLTDGSTGVKGIDEEGEEDVFIVKYDNTGNLQWLQSGGSIYEDRPVDIKTDEVGNIYIAGEFGNYHGSPKPDSAFAYFGTDTLLGLGGRELYLVKYNADGSVLWSIALGGESGKETMGSIALDKYGNITIGGAFSGYMELNQVLLVSNAVGFVTSDMFVAKLNSIGQVIWAHNVSGSRTGGGAGGGGIWWGYVACNDAGDVYITGTYLACDMIFPGVTLKSTAGRNIYLAKYSASGTFQWAKTPFDALSYSWGVATNDKDEVYITGEFKNMAAIGDNTLISTGDDDVFIGKYDRNGNDIWGISAGGGGRDYSRSIATGNDGRLYIGGGFNSGAATFGSHFVTSSYDNDMFVAAFHAFPTGISGNAGGAAFSVYPNPAGKHLIIEGAVSGTTLQLFNVVGQEVHQSVINKSIETVNTSQLQPGVYILSLTDAQGNKDTRSIVKQ